jgi:formate hydrogenlyase subunit 3/multisubunit Na+/H+ antiporter MnhD subunit
VTPAALGLLVVIPLVGGAGAALFPRGPAYALAAGSLLATIAGALVTRGAAPLAIAETELALTPLGRLELLFIAVIGLALLGYHYVAARPPPLPALLPPLVAAISAGTLFTRDLLVAASFLQLAALIASLLMIGEQPEWGASLAGAIYLVLSALGGMALLFGFVLADVQRLSPGGLVTIQFVVATLTVGLALQWGAAPLHAWLPNAFQRAGPASTTLAISLVGPATLGLLLQALSVLPQLVSDERVNGFLTLGGLLTAAFGAAASLAPSKPRRALGYVLVADLGYVLAGMATYTRIGVAGAALHMAHRSLAAFALLAAAHELEHEHRATEPPAPYLWGALLVAILAISGVPPLAGFAADWAVLQALSLVDSRLAVALALTSVVSLVGALSALGRLRRDYPVPWRRPSGVESYVMAAAGVSALWVIVPGPALGAIHAALGELTFLKPF